MLWELFSSFLTIGLASFGGGYAIIPVMESEVSTHGWMTTRELTEIIAVASMSPGPMATNSAILIGYKTAGLSGAIVSTLGTVLPSFIIILLIGGIFLRVHQSRLVRSAFYGLRPTITGLILYAAVHFAISNQLIGSFTTRTFSYLFIFVFSLFALTRLKMHSIHVIALSALFGIAFYS